jgi:hypothetical protein
MNSPITQVCIPGVGVISCLAPRSDLVFASYKKLPQKRKRKILHHQMPRSITKANLDKRKGMNGTRSELLV